MFHLVDDVNINMTAGVFEAALIIVASLCNAQKNVVLLNHVHNIHTQRLNTMQMQAHDMLYANKHTT